MRHATDRLCVLYISLAHNQQRQLNALDHAPQVLLPYYASRTFSSFLSDGKNEFDEHNCILLFQIRRRLGCVRAP